MTEPAHRSVIWSARSRRDLEGIRAYIGQFKPLAAQRFAARLVAAVESLADHPNRGRPAGQVHEMVAVSPYVVRYRVTATTVQIIHITHGAQRPE
jgi:plasmid stabilization system protein ParE